jgi:hydroxyacylglutathione hydrolase
MFLRMVYDDRLAAAAYLIGCQKTGEAIVIDPQRDVDRYERLAAANGLRIVAGTETHIHADFLSGLRELAERGATVYVSDEGDADWKYQWLDKRSGGGSYDHRLLKHGSRFSVGNIDLQAVHTPGHTPEHLCFMVTDRGGGADRPIGVATGDFVFVGDLGRPDLLESAAGIAGQADSSAHRLFGSVGQFLKWPDYLQVWPGHGAGSACGKSLGAVPQSTVGYEKMFSPAIRAAGAGEDTFVRFILEGQPEPPLYFARMKRDNKLGPPILSRLPEPRQATPRELADINPGSAAIIDTRPWSAFRTAHARGALSIALGSSFCTDAGSVVDEGEPIYLVVAPTQLEDAVRGLVRIGLDRVVAWVDAREMGENGSTSAVREMSVPEAAAMIRDQSRILLDVRRSTEFAEGHIPGARNIAHTRLLSRLAEVPKDQPILVTCRSGARSAVACSLLARHGYDVTNLAGGFLAWEKADLPIER